MSYYTDNGKYQKLLDELAFLLNVLGESANLLGAVLLILHEWYENSVTALETLQKLRKGRFQLSSKGYNYIENYFTAHDSLENKSYEDLVSNVLLFIGNEKKRTGQDARLNYQQINKVKQIKKVGKKITFEGSQERSKKIIANALRKGRAQQDTTLKQESDVKQDSGRCPKDKILNPATGRCVLRTGKIGQKLLGK